MYFEIDGFKITEKIRRPVLYNLKDNLQYSFVIFKPLSYCFKETIELDVKALFARPPVLRPIKPGDVTKEF